VKRKETIRLLTALITITFVLTIGAVSTGNAAPSKRSNPRVETARIARMQVRVWHCEDQRGVTRTAASVPPGSLPTSNPYRAWVLNLWKQRLGACLKVLHAHDDVLRRLRRGLSGTPMAGSERALEAAGRRWHVHPAFIAAIAGTESSFGSAACSGAPKNAFGLASCGSGWHVPYFPTWDSAYDFMGRFLSGRWPDARTTYDYRGYAANSQAWGAKCAYWMRERFGYGPEVRY
jgi:hypothetical protein